MSGATVIIRKQNKMIRRFRDVGAISPDSARGLAEVGVRDSWVFRRLVSRGVFVHVGSDNYYMDENAADAFVHYRRTRALILVALAVLAFVIWLIVRR